MHITTWATRICSFCETDIQAREISLPSWSCTWETLWKEIKLWSNLGSLKRYPSCWMLFDRSNLLTARRPIGLPKIWFYGQTAWSTIPLRRASRISRVICWMLENAYFILGKSTFAAEVPTKWIFRLKFPSSNTYFYAHDFIPLKQHFFLPQIFNLNVRKFEAYEEAYFASWQFLCHQ